MDTLERIAMQVRRDIIRMIHGAASGHPGGSLGAADLLTALYFEILELDPHAFSMTGKGEDVFYLSNGHLSAAWYSVLARKGFFPVQELATFRKLESRLQGHPATAEHLPGIRIASGSLGQGLSAAIGHALGKKLSGDTKNVFVLMGDGEIQEGQIWEAAMYAGSKHVDNLIGVIDFNQQQIDGSTSEVLPPGNLVKKWESFGWHVLECNGNKMQELIKTLRQAKKLTGQQQPILILMHTIMGFGVDYMMGTHLWHGTPPNDEQAARALEQLHETIGDF